jgi:hypothetical protein
MVLTEEHGEATFRVNDLTRVEISAQHQAMLNLRPVPQAGGPQTGVAGNGPPPPPARPAKAGQAANHNHTASDETTRTGRQAEPAQGQPHDTNVLTDPWRGNNQELDGQGEPIPPVHPVRTRRPWYPEGREGSQQPPTGKGWPVRGDGRCLYRAYARALFDPAHVYARTSNGTGTNPVIEEMEVNLADRLRRETCNEMERRPARYFGNEADAGTLATIRHLRNPSEWGSYPAQLALAEITGAPSIAYCRNPRIRQWYDTGLAQQRAGQHGTQEEMVTLLYDGLYHYELMNMTKLGLDSPIIQNPEIVILHEVAERGNIPAHRDKLESTYVSLSFYIRTLWTA